MNAKLFTKIIQLKSDKDFEILKDIDSYAIRGGNNCEKLKSCGTFASKTKVKHPNPVLISCCNYSLNGKKIIL
ncbi:MAG: hypothetical protein E7Y34_01710 [Mycoplasma sp.]|nr:hypothetical protein [Mycoplasma sp.]